MLYEKRNLTDEQAEKIIGEKMLARINAINKWAKENDYIIAFHSTYKSNVQGILQEGLKLYTGIYSMGDIENRFEVLNNSSVSEKALDILEEEVRKTERRCKITKLYDTYTPGKATTTGVELTAKELLGYNHNGGDVTIVLCYPRKPTPNFRKTTASFLEGTYSKHYDCGLRRSITAELSHDKTGIDYISKYLYPTEGILFAFDRDNIKIKMNKNFDETYYFDKNYIPKHDIQKGDLIKKIDEAVDSLNYQGKNVI